MADDKGFNLLHHGVLKGNPKTDKVAFLIDIVKMLEKPSKETLQNWLDHRSNQDRFTPLHFASYKGNLTAINTLLRAGADRNAKTQTELNMLHLAAQGDQPQSMYLFKELGLDLNSKDWRGSTPLHWACFRQSEFVLSFMMAWGPDLDLVDQEGNTALHLAVKFTQKATSSRMVRFLLLRGARTDIVNSLG
jgi:palmitoyltransferase ZDHHC13/17